MKKSQSLTSSSFLALLSLLCVNSTTFANDNQLPKVIVNHDLYSHYFNDSAISLLGESADTVIAAIDDDYNKITQTGAAFSLNLSYGQSLVTFKPPGRYEDWLCNTLEVDCQQYFYSAESDNLLILKNERPDFISELISGKDLQTQNRFIASVRMNDHHHMQKAEDFLNKPVTLLPSESPIRRVSAIEPWFLFMLENKRLIVGGKERDTQERPLGAGATCEAKKGYKFFNYAHQVSRDYKLDQVKSLLDDVNTQNLELDFARTPCLFSKGTSLSQRKNFMLKFLKAIIDYRNEIDSYTGRFVNLIVKVPIDSVLKVPIDTVLSDIGLSLTMLVADLQVEAVVLSKVAPYTHSNWVYPEELKGKEFPTKIYGEVYHIGDASGTTRRPSSKREILTAAYEVLNTGFDGVYLFNLNYHHQYNDNLLPHETFEWNDIASCINSVNCLQSVRPAYFFSLRNTRHDEDNQLSVGNSVGEISFIVNNLEQRENYNNRVFLRIQAANQAEGTEFRARDLNIEVNGKVLTVAKTTMIPRVDSTPSESSLWRNDLGSVHRFIPLEYLKNGENSIRIYDKNKESDILVNVSVSFD